MRRASPYYPNRRITRTNIILVRHAVGTSVAKDSTAALEAILWGAGAWGNEIHRG